jgi:hypothetical protein
MSVDLILLNREQIIEHALKWMKENYPARTEHYNKCIRDLRFVLGAYALDFKENTDTNIKFIGQAFWKGGVRQLQEYEAEISVHNFIVDYIKDNFSTDESFITKLVDLKNKLVHIIEHGPEPSVMDVIGKRKHVYVYKEDDIPDASTIKDIFLKAWQITPSKQNIMPYKVSILGPKSRETKFKIYNKVVGNHVYMEEEGLKEGAITHVSNKINPHYKHVLENPYLVVFSQRVCTDDDINPFYQRQIEQGHFMEQASEKWVDRIKSSTAVEVGLFAQNVAALCLDKSLDYSFTVCFPGDVNKWSDISFVEHPVLLLMSIGKAETYRRDLLVRSDQDYKTSFGNVVKFEED